mmetsp:Transcript_92781/g.193925  ORF Transcript_92781/g.193925 Transcript_92781/m.193925 type:complete len:300 (+) Transcript_92781:1422-2321(+)
MSWLFEGPMPMPVASLVAPGMVVAVLSSAISRLVSSFMGAEVSAASLRPRSRSRLRETCEASMGSWTSFETGSPCFFVSPCSGDSLGSGRGSGLSSSESHAKIRLEVDVKNPAEPPSLRIRTRFFDQFSSWPLEIRPTAAVLGASKTSCSNSSMLIVPSDSILSSRPIILAYKSLQSPEPSRSRRVATALRSFSEMEEGSEAETNWPKAARIRDETKCLNSVRSNLPSPSSSKCRTTCRCRSAESSGRSNPKACMVTRSSSASTAPSAFVSKRAKSPFKVSCLRSSSQRCILFPERTLS